MKPPDPLPPCFHPESYDKTLDTFYQTRPDKAPPGYISIKERQKGATTSPNQQQNQRGNDLIQSKIQDLEELNRFNHTLQDQLQEVKGYLQETASRIDSFESRGGHATVPNRQVGPSQRSHTPLGTSRTERDRREKAASQKERDDSTSIRWRGNFDWIGGRSKLQRMNTDRSVLTMDSFASDDFNPDQPKRLSTPTKEWFKNVGHLTGSEQCRPGGLPKRMKREDFVEGQSTMLLVQGTKRQRAPAPGAHLKERTPRNTMDPHQSFKCSVPVMDDTRRPRTGTNRSRADYHVKHPGLSIITKERPLRAFTNAQMVGV